jgi:hypothetical protein
MVLEATIALASASFRLRTRPFSRVARSLGQAQPIDFSTPDCTVPREALRISEAVSMAARNLPWVPKCLPQAMATKRLLDRRRIESALCVGVRPGLAEFEAHAWVCVGGLIVIGDDESRGYRILAVFS